MKTPAFNQTNLFLFLRFRPEEQTRLTGSHVEMSKVSETTTQASLSVEGPVDSLSPSRAQTDFVLPQSCKPIIVSHT